MDKFTQKCIEKTQQTTYETSNKRQLKDKKKCIFYYFSVNKIIVISLNQNNLLCIFSLQVAWIHYEQSAILTVHNHVITRNPRISVTHDKHDKHRTWFLHINNVREEDHGRYMCQINTVTAKTQFGYLHVVGKFNSIIVLLSNSCKL